MIECCVCGARVEGVSKSLCMKIIDRNTKRFYCLNCLSDHLETSTEDLLYLAEEFKNEGCTLFQ